MKTLKSLVSDYILQHELRETSADQYHRIVGVYCSWAGGDPPIDEFTPRTLSEFLAAKQAAGRSSHYRKSLRNCLIALLRFSGKHDRVRPVRVEQLEPRTWTPADVAKLIIACNHLRGSEVRRRRWKNLIAVAYYTGLSHCDILPLTKADFGADGILRSKRRKTGRRVTVSIPLWLLNDLPATGQIFPMDCSLEAFRGTFRRIAKRAGLTGTFKTLRKTAGTLVDQHFPGQGHLFLANTRKVFDEHYRAPDIIPLMPPGLFDRPAG